MTGGTGFLGKYLIRHLQDCKYNVVLFARAEEHAEECVPFASEVYTTDYSVDSLKKGLEGVDEVIHLVGQTLQRDSNPLCISAFVKVNVGVLENILIAGTETGIKTVYQMSSNNIYSSANQMPFSETDIPVPSSIYGLSKQFAEALGTYVSHKTSIKVVSLRLARLYGYGERDSVVFTKYMKLAMNHQPLEIWGEGKTSIEYLYVRDVVDAIECAVRMSIPSGIYNVGCNRSYSVLEIAEAINRVTGNKDNLVFDRTKPEGNYHILMDSSKFCKAANWKAKWDLDSAIAEMYQLYTNE